MSSASITRKKSQLAKKEADRKLHPRAYYMGADCRQSGGAKLASPFNAISINGAWWMAGWNDTDLELGRTHENQESGVEASSAPESVSLAA